MIVQKIKDYNTTHNNRSLSNNWCHKVGVVSM